MIVVLEHARALTDLTFYFGPRPDTAAVAAALATSPALPNLETVTMACDKSTFRVLDTQAPRLRSFSDSGPTSAKAMTALAESSLPQRLEYLSLSGQYKLPPSAAAIARAPFARLLQLDLRSVELDVELCPTLDTLARLSLSFCKLGDGIADSIRKRWPHAEIR